MVITYNGIAYRVIEIRGGVIVAEPLNGGPVIHIDERAA
jgi:hypothetical protein